MSGREHEDARDLGEFCPTCGAALAYDKSGHILYGGRLSYRDFEQILLSLGASGSDVRRLWPEQPSTSVRYDGEFYLAWLRDGERVMSAGDGTGAAIIVSPDGSERRLNIGDEVDAPAAKDCRCGRHHVCAEHIGEGR